MRLGARSAGEISVAFFAMTEAGHFQRLRSLISCTANRGMRTYVFTDRRFAADVERAGGSFVDLLGTYPLEDADAESRPVPCRYVTFAGRYADEIVEEVERLGPALVIYDTFAVIGHIVGRALGVPYVNVCAGHNVNPARFVPQLESDPRVSVSERCFQAVEILRDDYGLQDASPFSYVSGLSPFLNVYCEPPAFLTESERRPFEPIAFFGSLPPLDEIERRQRDGARSWFGPGAAELNVYVSFGTVVWRYWAAEALAALQKLSDSFSAMPGVRAVIGLGGAQIADDAVRALTKPNVTVAGYVDQWRILHEADVFVTHHGLNSTHEAIYSGVPMISYPFFSDQPALAERCRRLGLAIPLTDSPMAPVTTEDVTAALSELSRRRDALRTRLAEARAWELQVVAERDSVLERIAGLLSA
jgi:MGT family glycosyltransferase